MDNSTSGLTRISSSTCRASRSSARVSTATPDSFWISILMRRRSAAGATLIIWRAPGTSGRRRAGLGRRGVLGVVLRVGVDDLADEAVPDDVVRRQPDEV